MGVSLNSAISSAAAYSEELRTNKSCLTSQLTNKLSMINNNSRGIITAAINLSKATMNPKLSKLNNMITLEM